MKIVIIVVCFYATMNILCAQTPGTIKWTFETGAVISPSPPAISNDGTIYFGSTDKKIYAIYPNGEKRWEFITESSYRAGPVIGDNGTIYCGDDRLLYAINPDGSKIWEYELPYSITSIVIGAESTIYAGMIDFNSFPPAKLDTNFYAINSDGTQKKGIKVGETDSYTFGTPAIGSDGTIYTGLMDSVIYAIDKNGRTKWKFRTGGSIYFSPAIDSDGTVYIGSTDSILYALNPDGTQKWKFKSAHSISTSLAISADGTLYFTSGQFLYSIDREGQQNWVYTSNNGYLIPPTVGSNGTIYIRSADSIHAVNPNGFNKWKYAANGQSSLAIGLDSTVYFGSGNDLYAIYDSVVGLADSPWPRFLKDNTSNSSSYNANCPQAQVLQDHFFTPGGIITLDGSTSYDPDGEPLHYIWRVAEKPAGSPITLTDSTSAIINVFIPAGYRGEYRIALTVTDHDDGYSSTNIFVNTEKKWVFDTAVSIESHPAVALDSTLYIGSPDSNLYAINADGSTRWIFKTGDAIYASPAIGSDGTVYIGSLDGNLYAIHPDGTLSWVFETRGAIYSSPAIGLDGIIYFGSDDRKFYALYPNGEIYWQFQTQEVLRGSPVIGPDGTIYIRNYAINPDGNLKFRLPQGNDRCSPVIDAKGTLYLASGVLFALNTDGTVKWSFDPHGGGMNSCPAIGADGTLYIGGENHRFYALNPDGSQKWEFETGGAIHSSPLITSDGTIFFTSADQNLYALNPDGSKKWTYKTAHAIRAAPAIGQDGTVYIISDNREMHAVYNPYIELDNSPWPKFRKNNYNTGNSYNPDCPRARLAEKNISTSAGIISLDGSSSFDPDGDSMHYLWRIVEKPEDSPLLLTDSISAIIQVNIPAGYYGEYRFSLTVTDHQDGSSSDIALVSVLVKWQFQSQGNIRSTPALAQDGTIYVGSMDSSLYALNSNGQTNWEFKTRGSITASPALDVWGTIYIGSWDSTVYAIHPDGRPKWQYRTGGYVRSSAAIGADGTIYVGSRDRKLHALDNDGHIKWTFETGDEVYSSPAIGDDGTIYVGSDDRKLYALASDGALKWEFITEGAVRSSPAIGEDGTIYFGSHDQKLYAVDVEGSKLWEFRTSGTINSSPILSLAWCWRECQYSVLIGSNDHNLYAIDADGKERWRFSTDGQLEFAPASSQNGNIIIGTGHSTLYILDRSGILIREYQTGNTINASPVIGTDGTVYIGSDDDRLYAFYNDGGGLSKDSPWPKFRHDEHNTGNVFYVTALEPRESKIPEVYNVTNAYPNPFNTLTMIEFTLPQKEKVEIRIYNISGQLVAELMKEFKNAGKYKVTWNAKNMASGMYFINFKAGRFVKFQKCILLK